MRALGASRTSLVPGGVLAGPWVRNDLWRRARAVPSLDLRFADNKSLVDAVTGASLVTFTRASNGTYTDSAGVIQTAATDVPRFDHDPITGESLGLLVEEQRSNLIRNNTGVGAVAGTPGTLPTNWSLLGGTGLTTQVVGTGTENGITYLDFKFSGTTGTTFTGVQVDGGFSGLETASSYTTSFYLKRTAGSLTNLSNAGIYLRYNLTPNGQTDIFGTVSSLAGPSDALISSRYTVVGTTTGTLSGVGSVFILFSHASGVAVDLTLRIGLPQLEKGAFATSVIPTTTAAVTRNADVASITGSAFSGWYRQDEGTMFASGDFVNAGAVSFSRIIALAGANAGIDEISLYTRISIGAGDGSIFGAVTVNSSLEADLAAPIGPPNLSGGYRSAIAYKTNDFGLSSNGLAPTTDTSGILPTITQLIIMGNVRFQNKLSGHVRRITYWNQRLGNQVLQAITQ